MECSHDAHAYQTAVKMQPFVVLVQPFAAVISIDRTTWWVLHASLIMHSTAQHSTAQHSTAEHSTAQHSTAQHSTAQHSTAQHSTACIAHHVQLIMQAISVIRPLAAVSSCLEHDKGIACKLFHMTHAPSVKHSLNIGYICWGSPDTKKISMALKQRWHPKGVPPPRPPPPLSRKSLM